MKESVCPPFVRAKAVWAGKRVLASAVVLAFLVGFVSDASAEGRHRRATSRVRPGASNSFVSRDKMDRDVARHADGLTRFATADVIVTLEDGATLPASFQRFSHNGELHVIHGYVLDQVPV